MLGIKRSIINFSLATAIMATFVIGLSSFRVQATAPSSRVKKKVILITIDGLMPEFYLDNTYAVPTLKKLRDEGAYAGGVEVVFPSLTYPSHTTLITGVYPGEHGILSNTLFTWETGPSLAWYWEADKIKVPSIFDYVQKIGGKTASVRWPVTIGERSVNFLVPEVFSMQGFYEGDNFELTKKYTTPGLMEEITANIKMKRYVDYLQTDIWVAQAAAFIIQNKNPDFMALHLANLDHVEHVSGPFSKDVEIALEEVDSHIQTIVEGVDFKTTCLIITGDHGFANVSKKLNPNVLFVEKGWITLDSNGNIQDWQVIAHASGAQAAIYIKDQKRQPAVQKFLEEKSTEGFNIISKDDLVKLGAYPEASMAIEGQLGYTISGGTTGPFVSSSGDVRGQHGFLPSHPELRTGLIMRGCGFAPGMRWELAHSIDIAPTIAQIMGFTGETFVGRPLR